MKKAVWPLVLAMSLVASAFLVTPAAAAPEIPAEPNIVDQAGDANYHSQATGTAASPSWNGADLLAVWFTHDAENVYAHFQTTNAANVDSINYAVRFDPGVGDDCVGIWGVSAGAGNDAITRLDLSGDCGDSREDVGEFIVEEGPDDTAIWTATVPRSSADVFGDGQVFAGPNAFTRHYIPGVAYATTIDNTDVGTDYVITSDEATEESEESSKDSKKKSKKKGKKGKKKGAGKKKKEPEMCAAYEPGELGAEAETTVVTDEATEEAPLEVPVETHEGLGFTSTDPGGDTGPTSHVYHNLQVDSESPTKGLFVRVEYFEAFDYDIFLRLADGTAVAYEADFNPVPEGLGGTEGAHAEQGAGQIDGFESADCDGFTFDIASAITPGGEVTMKLWLGEPGGGEEGGARAALSLMQETLA